MPLECLHTVPELRAKVRSYRLLGQRVGFVPTMGALHKGHLSLVRLAKDKAEKVVVSIFVNPLQFGPQEDFAKYPRTEDADLNLLSSAGVALAFLPSVHELYPEDFTTVVSVPSLSRVLCGVSRPGHFDGVATVVAKLLNACEPEIAVFGEKDYQQLLIIQRMAHDLNISTQIIGAPTYRDDDGLAASSRNAYLKNTERTIAGQLPKTLVHLIKQAVQGAHLAGLENAGRDLLLYKGFTRVEYLEFRSERDLKTARVVDSDTRLFVAAWIGRTRLIDNMKVTVPAEELTHQP